MSSKNGNKPLNNFSVASFSLGLSGIILFFVPILNFILQLLAIFSGVVALFQVQKHKTTGLWLAIIGIIFGVAGFLLSVYIPNAALSIL